MNRRNFLGILSGAGVIATAGCMENNGLGGDYPGAELAEKQLVNAQRTEPAITSYNINPSEESSEIDIEVTNNGIAGRYYINWFEQTEELTDSTIELPESGVPNNELEMYQLARLSERDEFSQVSRESPTETIEADSGESISRSYQFEHTSPDSNINSPESRFFCILVPMTFQLTLNIEEPGTYFYTIYNHSPENPDQSFEYATRQEEFSEAGEYTITLQRNLPPAPTQPVYRVTVENLDYV